MFISRFLQSLAILFVIMKKVGDNMKIVFQGDSITETRRNKDNPSDCGYGYVCKILDELEGHEIINQGLSGDRSYEVLKRWDQTIQLKPDIITLLIGINDVWKTMSGVHPTNTTEYEKNLRTIIETTKQQLPNTTLILLAPFALNFGFVNDEWIEVLKVEQQIVKDLGIEYNLDVVDLQALFDVALNTYDQKEMFWDGVHPTDLGHRLISDEVYKTLKPYIK